MKNTRLAFFTGCELPGAGETDTVIRTLPESILLIRYGINAYTKNNENGEFEFTQEDADCVIADFEAKGHDLVIDYEHQSLSGEKAPAAGWIHRLEKCSDGIKAHIRYWTDEAKQYLLAGQYRYFSPTLYFSRSGKHVTAIHSAALTNHPAMHGIPPLVADDLTVSAPGEASSAHSIANQIEPNCTKEEEQMNELLLKLGLECFSSAGEDQQKKALSQRVDALLETEEKMLSFLSRKGFADLTSAEEALDRMEIEERSRQIQQAFREGKLSEGMRSWAEKFASQDPAGFALWASEAPRIIPDNQNTECRAQDHSTLDMESFDSEQSRILHLLGLTGADVTMNTEKENRKGNDHGCSYL